MFKLKAKVKKFIENRQYIEAESLLEQNVFLLKEKAMYCYIFEVYCYNEKFKKAREFFNVIVQENIENKYEIFNLLINISKDMQYKDEILNLYYSMLSASNIQTGIIEIGDDLINSKRYSEARDFYKKILDIFPDNLIALKHSVQLSNFIGDFETTKKILGNSKIEEYKNFEFEYNILLNELEIAEKKQFLKSHPRTMLVAVTTKCNIKCLMCSRDKIWDIPEYIKNELISMFEYLEVVVWQGGEVFLYKHFFELIKMAQNNSRLRHIIITNGLFFTDIWIDLLLSINNLDLTVSIDGTTKEVYEKIRVGAKFEQLIDNLGRFNKKKKLTSSNISLTLRCAIMKSNYKQIVDFVSFAAKYGFNIIIFAPVQNLNTEENIWNNLSDEINNCICEQYKSALKLAKQFNINLITWLPVRHSNPVEYNNVKQNVSQKNNNIDYKINAYEKILCFRPWKQITLNVDGFIMPECLCQKQISTIDKVTSFYDVWNSDIMQEYRRKISIHNYEWCNRDCISGAIAEEHLKFISR